MQRPPILRVEAVSRHFGGLKAVDNVSLQLDPGVVHTVIGPNGAGKTTLFNVIAGALPPSGGRILLEGKDVTGWRPHEAARHGVGRTFQNIRLFKKLTVLENVLIARVKDSTTSILSSLLPIPRTSIQEQEFVEDALEAAGDRGARPSSGHHRHVPALRAAAAAGDSPGTGPTPQGHAAGRARGGIEPQREGGACRPPQQASRHGPLHPAHRAQHAAGDGGIGLHHGPRPR